MKKVLLEKKVINPYKVKGYKKLKSSHKKGLWDKRKRIKLSSDVTQITFDKPITRDELNKLLT